MTFSLRIQGYDQRFADLSGDGLYRYTLLRAWSPGPNRALVIGCNPSTADAVKDDQTIRRLRQLLGEAGYDGFTIANLFAFRATDPRSLRDVEDPIGHDNDRVLAEEIESAAAVIAAWGSSTWAPFHRRLTVVRFLLAKSQRPLLCFGRTKEGAPRHPSRLPRSARLEAYAA